MQMFGQPFVAPLRLRLPFVTRSIVKGEEEVLTSVDGHARVPLPDGRGSDSVRSWLGLGTVAARDHMRLRLGLGTVARLDGLMARSPATTKITSADQPPVAVFAALRAAS